MLFDVDEPRRQNDFSLFYPNGTVVPSYPSPGSDSGGIRLDSCNNFRCGNWRDDQFGEAGLGRLFDDYVSRCQRGGLPLI